MAKILIVDDEPEIARLVSAIMVSRGHEASTAVDGNEALAHVAADVPDAVILDRNLPKMDGQELCRRLRSDTRTRHVPVVMMVSDYIDVAEVQRTDGTSADEYVVKPFLGEVLVHNVERLLSRHRPTRPMMAVSIGDDSVS